MGQITILPGMEMMSLLAKTDHDISQVDFSINGNDLSVSGYTDQELQDAYDLYLPEYLSTSFNQARHSINVYAEWARQKLVEGTTEMQRNGWNIKAQSAIRIIAGNPVDFDNANIQKEADQRGFGETVAELAQIIFDKHANFGLLEATISGFQSKALQAVDDLEMIGDIANLTSTIDALRNDANLQLAALGVSFE